MNTRNVLFLLAIVCGRVVSFAPLIPRAVSSRTGKSLLQMQTTSTPSSPLVMTARPISIDPSLAFNTWEWCSNLGAPAALVAGAVLATLIEGQDSLSPKKSDRLYARILKQPSRLLLLRSFVLEIISIFVTTVTGTMLLSIGDAAVAGAPLAMVNYKSPIGFLMHNYEFEFLTAYMCFLQGLFNWLGSVVLELLIPKKGEGCGAWSIN